MSRDAMLAAIRRGLRRGPLPADQAAMLRGRLALHPRHLIPARSRLPHAGQINLFVANVEKEFGSVVRVPDLDAVPDAVATYLAAQNLPTDIVMAPHPDLQSIPWDTRPLLRLREGRAEATDLVSLQHAFAGIAETGTLMLPSAPQRPTTLNLLADTEIVLLRASRLVGAYEEAWDLLRSELDGMPRNVMLVTGPRVPRTSSRRWNSRAWPPPPARGAGGGRRRVMPLWPLIATLAAQTLATMALFSLPAIAPAVAPALHVQGELVGVFVSVVYGVGIISALFSPGSFTVSEPSARCKVYWRQPRQCCCSPRAQRCVARHFRRGPGVGLRRRRTGINASAGAAHPARVFNMVMSLRQIGVPLAACSARSAAAAAASPRLARGIARGTPRRPAASRAVADPAPKLGRRRQSDPPPARPRPARPVSLLHDGPMLRLSIASFSYSGTQLCFIAFMTTHLTTVVGSI